MKIGIYGGSFNPPHKMHLQMGIKLIENHFLDKVIYVPTGTKYPKPGLASNSDRYEMVKRMIGDYPNLEVSDYELKQELVYTYQTLTYFKEKYPNDEIYFILGSDLLKQITTWRNYTHILENFKILVTLRDEDTKEELSKLKIPNKENIIYTNLLLEPISSTKIREAIITRNDKFLKENLDKRVEEYITENNLYGKEEWNC